MKNTIALFDTPPDTADNQFCRQLIAAQKQTILFAVAEAALKQNGEVAGPIVQNALTTGFADLSDGLDWASLFALRLLADPSTNTEAAERIGRIPAVVKALCRNGNPVRDNPQLAVEFADGWPQPVFTSPDVLKGTSHYLPDTELPENTKWTAMPLSNSLAEARKLLTRTWPHVLPWTELLSPAFVCLNGALPTRHRSASFEPGSPLLLSQVGHAADQAEDIIHETQHYRLKALVAAHPEDFEGWDGDYPRVASPWRNDPRPVRGVLLGLHAFVSVNQFRLDTLKIRSADGGLLRRMAKSHVQNEQAMHIVEKTMKLRNKGSELLSFINALVAQQSDTISSVVPQVELLKAKRAVESHLEQVASLATS